MLNYDEFYPTPDSLIDKMLKDVDWSTIDSVLEPSAGKGNIADQIIKHIGNGYYGGLYYGHCDEEKNKAFIDCIEIQPELQGILRDKGYRVVHDNFLTYRTHKRYNLIVMNPPFSDGDKHLLHALDLVKDGGTVVCVLNAETIRNCYTNSRKLLSQKLNELGAEIQYLNGEFEQAERKTSVEIALIKATIPASERTSFIFDNLEKKDYAEVDDECTDLVGGDFIAQIIKHYEMEVEAGIALIKEYNAMCPYILDSIDEDKYTKPILELKLQRDSALSINGYVQNVRMKYWNALFRNKNFVGKLTSNLQHDLYDKVNELKDFDFSVYNIQQIQREMAYMMNKGVEDTIMDLFDELSAEHSWYPECKKNIHYYSGWATNKAHKINKKVIIPIHGAFGCYSWDKDELQTYNVYEVMSDIEKALTYLSTGTTCTEDDLMERLNIAKNNGQTKKIPLRYFNITLYKKGTCHIEFTDMELLDRLNIFGSRHRGWLPPSYGRKKYKDMTSEEQAVIDDFQGEDEYSKVIAAPDKYIIEASKILQIGSGQVA